MIWNPCLEDMNTLSLFEFSNLSYQRNLEPDSNHDFIFSASIRTVNMLPSIDHILPAPTPRNPNDDCGAELRGHVVHALWFTAKISNSVKYEDRKNRVSCTVRRNQI